MRPGQKQSGPAATKYLPIASFRGTRQLPFWLISLETSFLRCGRGDSQGTGAVSREGHEGGATNQKQKTTEL